MENMTPERWHYTEEYSRAVFGKQDDHLANLMKEGLANGLPDISVSADVGRMLMILTSMAQAKLAIELGTLGGYSAIWIARGLSQDGRLITVELENKFADFAEEQFRKAKVADQIELRRGTALDILPQLASEFGPGTVDLVFFDAIKTEYPRYWKIVKPMIRVGGLIVADNVYGSGDWWIDDEDHPSRIAADQFSRLVTSDPDFEAVAIPLREGVLVGRRMK